MSKLLCSCAGRRRRRRGSSSSSRTPTPTPRAQRRRNFPRDDVLRVPPAGGPWAPGSKKQDPQPRVVHPFPDVIAGQVGTSDTSQPPQPPQPQTPPSPVSNLPDTQECVPLQPLAAEPSAPTEMELNSMRSSTSDEGSLPMASRERLAHSRETLPIGADPAPFTPTAPLTNCAPTRASCGSLRKTPHGSSSAVDDPCCKDSGEVWVKMDPSSAVLPRRKISGRSPATSVDQVWSKAGARRRLHDSGTAWSTEDFTDRGDDIWVRAKTDTKPIDRQEEQKENKPIANERLSADRLHSVADVSGPNNRGTKGKSLTLDRGAAVKLKSGAKEDRSSFLNWLWTLFRSKRKDTKDESDPCISKTRQDANASNAANVLHTEEKTDMKEKRILGEAARAVLTGSDFRLIDDDEDGDVYEDACDVRVHPDYSVKEGQDDVAVNPEIAKRLEDIDEVLKAVYERNIAYGRSVSMQRLAITPGEKYQGASREGSREADGDKSSSHLSLSRAGERTALLPEGDSSHKCHEKKISVGSSSPSSYYSHSRSESELTNDDEFLALGTPPHPPKVKPSQAGYMRLSEPNFSNAECAQFKVGRFLQQSNDEQWFGHSDQSLEGRLTGLHGATGNTDDVGITNVVSEGSVAVEDKLMKLTTTFDEGVRAIRQDIEQCLASAQQSSAGEASAEFISMESNRPKISRQPTPPTLVVSEEVEDNDRDLCGFTDDGLDDILKISSTADMEADEWAGFDPAAWSRERGLAVPADSSCYTSILPSGKQLVDVRQGEVEGVSRNESWADIQRALQELVDSQDSALLQELKKAPEDETLLEPVLEETDLLKIEAVSPLKTGQMTAVTTSQTPHPELVTQQVLSKNNDTSQMPDTSRSTATIGVFPVPHPTESSQQLKSKNDHYHLNEETVAAPKGPFHDSNFSKGKQDPESEARPALQPQFHEVPSVTEQSVVSPVVKELGDSGNNESFFDDAFDRRELPVKPAQQCIADVSHFSQERTESSQENLLPVSSVNVFTLSDETLNNLRSAAQNMKKSTALELLTPTDELFEDRLKISQAPSGHLLEDLPVAQGRTVSHLDTVKDITIKEVPQNALDAQTKASSSLEKFIPGKINTECMEEPNKETEVSSDILTPTEPVPSVSEDFVLSRLTNVTPNASNLQESFISLQIKETDSRDKADSKPLDSHDSPKSQQMEEEHPLLADQQQLGLPVLGAVKVSEPLQWEKPLLESEDGLEECHTSKATDAFLGRDLVEKKEINAAVTAAKTVVSGKGMLDQSNNLISTLVDISSDSFCHSADDSGLFSISASNTLNEQNRQDLDSKMPQSLRDTPVTHEWPLPSERQPEQKLTDVGTPDINMVSQLFDTTWQAARSEEEASNIMDTSLVVPSPLTYQPKEVVDDSTLSHEASKKSESGGKVGSPYDVLEEFVEVSPSSQLHNLKEQSHDLRDIANQLQHLKEKSPASGDTTSHLKSLKQQSHDVGNIAGHPQNLKDESHDFRDIVGQHSEGWLENETGQSSAFRITMGKTVDTGLKTASRDIPTDSVWLSLDRSLEDLKRPAVSFPPDLSSTSALLPSVDQIPEMQVLDRQEGDDCNRSNMQKNKIENPFTRSNSIPQKEDTTTEKSDPMFSGPSGRSSMSTLESAWFPSEDQFFTNESPSEIKGDSERQKCTMPSSDKASDSQQETEWWSAKGFDSLSHFGEQDFSFNGNEVQPEAPQQWDSYIWTGELLPSNTSSSTPTDIAKAFSIDIKSYDKGDDPFAVASNETVSVSAAENKDLLKKLCESPLDEFSSQSFTDDGYLGLSMTEAPLSTTAASQPPQDSVHAQQQRHQSVSVTEQLSCDESSAAIHVIGQKAPVLRSETTTPALNEPTRGDPIDNYKSSLRNEQEMPIDAVPMDSNPPKQLPSTGDDTAASQSSRSVCEVEQKEADDFLAVGSVADAKVSVEELSISSRSDSPPPLVEVSPSDIANNLDLPEVPASVVEEHHPSDHSIPDVSTAAASTEQTAKPHVESTETPRSVELTSLVEVAADISHASNREQSTESNLMLPAEGTSTSAKTSSGSSTESQGAVVKAVEKSVTSGESPLETDSYSEDSVFLDDEEGGDILGKAGFILHPITRQLIRRSSSVSSEPLSPTAATGTLTVTPENTEEEPSVAADGGQVLMAEETREKPQSAGKVEVVAKPGPTERRESVVLEKITALKHHISEGIQHGKDSVYSTERKLLEKVQSWMAPAEKSSGKVTEKVIAEEEDVSGNNQTEPRVSEMLKSEKGKSTPTTPLEVENKIIEKGDEKLEEFQASTSDTSNSETKTKVTEDKDEKQNIPHPPPPEVKTGAVGITYAGPALKIDEALKTTSPPEEINVAPDTKIKEFSIGKILVENRAAMETLPLTPEGDTIIEMEDFEYETIVVDRDPLLGQEFTIVVKSGSDSEHSSSHSKTGVISPQRLQTSGSNEGTSDFHKNESPSPSLGYLKNSEADSHRTTDCSSSPVGSDHDYFFEEIPQQSLEYGNQTPNPFIYEEDVSDDADVECGDSSRPATSSSDDWYFSTSRSVDGGLALSYGPPSNASSRIDLRKLDTLDTTELGNSAKMANVKDEDGIQHETHLQLPPATQKQNLLEVQHIDLKPLSGEASPGGRSCGSYDGPDYYDIEKRIDSVLKRIDALQESDPTFREPDCGISGTNPFDMSEDDWLSIQSGVPQEGLAELPDEPTVEGCGSTIEEDQRFLEETYLNTGKKSGRLQRVCTRQNLDGKEDLDANPFSAVADRYVLSSGSVLSSSSSIPETSSDSGDQDKNSSSNPFLQTIYEKGLLSQSALSIDLPNPFLYTEAEIRDQLRKAGFSSEEEIFPLSPPGGTVSEASSGVAGDRSCSPDSTSSDSSDGTLVQDPLPVLPVPTQEILLPPRSPDGGTQPLKGFSACKESESINRIVNSERSTKEAEVQEVRNFNLPDVVSKDVDIHQATDSRGFQENTTSDFQKCQTASGLPQVHQPVHFDPSKLAVGVSALSVRTETGFQVPSRFSVSLAVQNESLEQVGNTVSSDSCVFPGDCKQCTSIDSHAKQSFQCRLPKDATESVVGELPDLVGTACGAVEEGSSESDGGKQLPPDSVGTSTLQQQPREPTTNETSNDGNQQGDGGRAPAATFRRRPL